MDKPTFKNRANKSYKVDGREIWESRSSAVIAVVLALYKDNVFVLTEKRSAKMEDGAGLWALPSGYMDWDEDGWSALERELYEETSFYVAKFENRVVFDNDKEPFFVNTSPTENRQNIALSYCIIYDFSDGLPTYVEKYKDSEVDEIKWLPLERVFSPNIKWAFEHDKRVERAVEKFEKYLV